MNCTEEKNHYHAVSLSGGKDSTAMLLLMIERGMPIDMVLSADTGMEFPEMYAHLAKLDEHLYRERGIHITTLRHPKGFEYLMFDEPKQKAKTLKNRARLGISPYTVIAAAKSICTGSGQITDADLANPEVVGIEAFTLIIHALLIVRYGLDALKITTKKAA